MSKTKPSVMFARMSVDSKRLIQRAAKVEQVSDNIFLVDAGVKRAKQVLLMHGNDGDLSFLDRFESKESLSHGMD